MNTEVLTLETLPKAVGTLLEKVNRLETLLTQKQEQPTPEPTEEFLSIEEAAKLLHLTVPTMYSKHSRGELPGVSKRGKRLYFSKKILLEWLEAGTKKTNDEVKQEAESFLNKKGGRNG